MMRRLFSSTFWSGVADRLLAPPPRPTLAQQKARAMGDAEDSVAYGWRSAHEALASAERHLDRAVVAVDAAALPDGPWQRSRGGRG